MNYRDEVLDIFVEDQNCKGLDIQEAKDIFNETPFYKIENWLVRQGYDLEEIKKK